MSGKYYIRSLASGERIFANTLAEINAIAKREANRFAQAVQVYSTPAGRKSHRQASYARNPVSKRYGFVRSIERIGVGQYAWSISKDGKTISQGVEPTKADAQRVVRSTTNWLNDRGYNSNPATKASKARKRAASKRGAYVVWRQEGREKRQRFANKGLATIEAKKLKAGGYAGVRVIGA